MRWIFPARLPDRRDFSAPVHDGDTLWLELDKGHRDATIKDSRLKLAYAPELNQPGGADAHAWVMAWLLRHTEDGSGWPLAVETFKTKTGNDVQTLGRYVGMVYAGDPEDVRTRPDTPCLNLELNAWLATHPEWGRGIG